MANTQKELIHYQCVEGSSDEDLSNKVNAAIIQLKKETSKSKRDVINVLCEGPVQKSPNGNGFTYIQKLAVYRLMKVRRDGPVKPLKKYDRKEAERVREQKRRQIYYNRLIDTITSLKKVV